METSLSIGISFAAGVLSFLSPCVLPLIPAYLSLMGGTTLGEMIESREIRRGAFFNTVFFVIGFSIVFIALGILFTSTFAILGGVSRTINIVAGSIVMVLGLNFIFNFWKLLNFEKRFHSTNRPTSAPASLLFGMAFGAGWSPCIGPILSSILFLAGSEGSLTRGIALLIAYSFGLGLPFLLTGLFLPRAIKQLNQIKKHLPTIKVVSGIFLVTIGLFIAIGRMQQFNIWLFSAAYSIEEWEELNPVRARAVFGGIFLGLSILIGYLYARRLKRDRSAGTKHIRPIRIALFTLFAAVGVLAFTGAIDVSRFLSFWFNYQGI